MVLEKITLDLQEMLPVILPLLFSGLLFHEINDIGLQSHAIQPVDAGNPSRTDAIDLDEFIPDDV